MRFPLRRPQPLRAAVLLRQRQPLRDPRILAEQLPHEARAIALAAAVQEYDVRWQLSLPGLRLLEDSADRLQRLLVGQMPAAAHDPLLEEPRPGAGELHAGVVVALKSEDVE